MKLEYQFMSEMVWFSFKCRNRCLVATFQEFVLILEYISWLLYLKAVRVKQDCLSPDHSNSTVIKLNFPALRELKKTHTHTHTRTRTLTCRIF